MSKYCLKLDDCYDYKNGFVLLFILMAKENAAYPNTWSFRIRMDDNERVYK